MGYYKDVKFMVKAVRKHALAHYEEDGWDYIVECWSDDEIIEVIRQCHTEAGAIQKMKEEIAPLAAYRADIQGTAF